MRWSRHHDDTSLGELMEERPDEAATATGAAAASDDDTAVRVPLADSPPDTAEPEASDSFLDDEDYLPQERTGPGRLTVALVAALVLAVGVLGGVWVQKQLGTSASAAAGGFGTGQGARTGTGTGQRGYGGTGTGTGAVPGGAAQGGAAQGGAPGGDASAGAGTGGAGTGGTSGAGTGGTSGSGAAATPVVVGTVTSAGKKSLVVTDLGGTKHTVTLTDTTTVTTSYTHGALKAGDTVAVVGSAATDGAVTATGLTVS